MGLFDRFRAPRITPEFEARLDREPEPQLVGPSRLPYEAEMARIRTEIDLDGMRRLYDSLPVGERGFMLQLLPGEEDAEGARELAEAWLFALHDRQDPFGKLLAGRWLHQLAWVHRGHGVASEVDARDGDEYLRLIATAMERLSAAAQGMPDDPTPLIALQLSHSEGPLDEAYAIAQRWRRLDPYNYEGLRALLKRVDARWGGGPNDWFEVASEIAANAPAGSAALALVAEAVIDRWYYLTTFTDAELDDVAERLFALEPVRALVRRAYDRRFRADAELEMPALAVAHLNWFMWVAYQCEMWDVAHDALGRLGGLVRDDIWDWYDDADPIDAFVEARDEIIDQAEFGGHGYR